MRCPRHYTLVLVRDDDYPSNLNLSQWTRRECACMFCGPDQADRVYCVSCGKDYAELVWAHEPANS